MIKISNEVKTGLMVISCFLILAWLVLKTGDVTFSKPEGYNVKLLFSFAGGIEANAPVRLAGVEVGKVKKIELVYTPRTQAILSVWLDEKAKVRKDSEAYINTLGLMGEKYIELTAGTSDEFLKPGDELVGEDPFQMEKLLKKAETIAENIDEALIDVKALAKNVNGMVEENRNGIGSIVENLEETSKNFNEFSDDIKRHPWKLLIKGKESGETTTRKTKRR
ncbi:MAG: MlaD family protein [Candidatus Omnitrophota bacterium]